MILLGFIPFMTSERRFEDSDLHSVLKDDGVDQVITTTYENASKVSIDEIKTAANSSDWAARIAYNELFGGVLISQSPGKGNRLHYHPDADECWVIIEGDWEWYIEGEGTSRVTKNDIVVVKQGTKHQITCIGNTPGIRFAITRPDVNHIYGD